MPTNIWSALGNGLTAAMSPGYSGMYMQALQMQQQQRQQAQMMEWRNQQLALDRENAAAQAPVLAGRAKEADARTALLGTQAGLNQQKLTTAQGAQKAQGKMGDLMRQGPPQAEPEFKFNPMSPEAGMEGVPTGNSGLREKYARDIQALAMEANPDHPERAVAAVTKFLSFMESGAATDPRVAQSIAGAKPVVGGPNRSTMAFPGGQTQRFGDVVLGQNQTMVGPGNKPVAEGRSEVPSGGVSTSAMTGEKTENPKPESELRLGNSANIYSRAYSLAIADGKEPEEARQIATQASEGWIVTAVKQKMGDKVKKVLQVPGKGGTNAPPPAAKQQIGRFIVEPAQ